jgi:FKBP-type peptidyl-prolyl cis-trans isomerase
MEAPMKNRFILAAIVMVVAGLAAFFWMRQQDLLRSLYKKALPQDQKILAKPLPNEISTEQLRPGNGNEVRFGETLQVHYVGMLENGKKFDSTRDRGMPLKFTLGSGQVIQGLDMGIVGMRINEMRRIRIPARFGYGDKGAGDGLVPGGATLIYEVELLNILLR